MPDLSPWMDRRIREIEQEHAAQVKVFPPSTCVECGMKIPAGNVQRCEHGGHCNHHIPRAVLAEITRLTQQVEDKERQVEHLKDVLHVDRSGLAAAVSNMRETARNYSWAGDSRGCYSYDDAEYRKEHRRMVDAIIAEADEALRLSGNTAHSECCGRYNPLNGKTLDKFPTVARAAESKCEAN